MKKYGVYHVFCKNDWKIVFQSQIQSLVNSGLFYSFSYLIRIFFLLSIFDKRIALKKKKPTRRNLLRKKK